MRKDNFVKELFKALEEQRGQSVNQKGKEGFLKSARTPEEFKQRIKEGQAFQLEETAGIHIVSIDMKIPPIVQVKGNFDDLSKMLSFALSEIIEQAIDRTGDRKGIEEHFRNIVEAAIFASKIK